MKTSLLKMRHLLPKTINITTINHRFYHVKPISFPTGSNIFPILLWLSLPSPYFIWIFFAWNGGVAFGMLWVYAGSMRDLCGIWRDFENAFALSFFFFFPGVWPGSSEGCSIAWLHFWYDRLSKYSTDPGPTTGDCVIFPGGGSREIVIMRRRISVL